MEHPYALAKAKPLHRVEEWEVGCTGEVLLSRVVGESEQLSVRCVFGRDGIETNMLGSQVVRVDNLGCEQVLDWYKQGWWMLVNACVLIKSLCCIWNR